MLLDRLFLLPIGYSWKNPFKSDVPKQRRFDTIKDLPTADFRYVIFFTPRSGSSYLTDLIQSTNCLGDAGEMFNPIIAWNVAGAMGSTSIEDYVDSLLRARNIAGVYSAELTWTHLDFMFGSPRQFLDLVKPSHFLWLKRDDYVAQAVSIMSMKQTGLAHTAGASRQDIESARNRVKYDGFRLRRIAKRLIWTELKTEAFFKTQGVSPLRLTYEHVTASAPDHLLGEITDFLSLDRVDPKERPSRHKKLAGEQSSEFARRFRKENKRLVARLNRLRRDIPTV